jgi:hypothetical protein
MDSYLRGGKSGVRREAVGVDLDEDRSRSRLEGESKCVSQGKRGARHYCYSMRLDSVDSVDMDSGGGVGLFGQEQEQADRIAEVGG